jgi:hypothetical protein
MSEPALSPVEQARQAWRRRRQAFEEASHNLTCRRDQAEAELRRKWALLHDAVESALASGVSFDDVARWLGLAPAALDHMLNMA